MSVYPKKYLGQHFLKDEGIASEIVDALTSAHAVDQIIEIGPGTGILTQYLLKRYREKLTMVDIDSESISYLRNKYPASVDRILQADFLKMDLRTLSNGKIAIIGNFPYNISSQILFKILENRGTVKEVVGMVQKEVGERIAAAPGRKIYGILSVLLSAFYDIQYLFTVEPEVFHPPPKVQSAVLRLIRNSTGQLDCNELFFTKIVKLGFQNRRKTLRNALKALNLPRKIHGLEILGRRAEQLSVEDFVELTKKIESSWKN
jgi:16S rRNA (adenine1518-N6/adenine1519-N6)-dimethyltransferase